MTISDELVVAKLPESGRNINQTALGAFFNTQSLGSR